MGTKYTGVIILSRDPDPRTIWSVDQDLTSDTDLDTAI
jgi:hypothetical protein